MVEKFVLNAILTRQVPYPGRLVTPYPGRLDLEELTAEHYHFFADCRWSRSREASPFFHQTASPLEQISPRVCLLGRVADAVRQSHFDDFAGVRCRFARPCSECGTHPMCSDVGAPHPTTKHILSR